MAQRFLPGVFLALYLAPVSVWADCNALVLERIEKMPRAGIYAKYSKELPEAERFAELYQSVDDLGNSLDRDDRGFLLVDAEEAARLSFCSSATYLLFCDVVAEMQRRGEVQLDPEVVSEMVEVGDKTEVIHGKLDGIGIFGHWNADGPGTAVLFHRLGLGRNFLGYRHAKPGDFLKIFWNDSIGKGERGHLVVYLGENEDGSAIRVWSSNMENSDGSSGYGTMWVEKSRIRRALFSRLESPANLNGWKSFSPEDKRSDYLVRIRATGSTEEEMSRATGAVD